MNAVFNVCFDQLDTNISYEEDRGKYETSYFLFGTKTWSEAIPQTQTFCLQADQIFALLSPAGVWALAQGKDNPAAAPCPQQLSKGPV